MVVKPFVSSACFTGFSLPPVLCPPHLNQRCLLSSSANPQRCSIGSNRKVSNFRIPKSGLRGNLASTGVPTSVPVRVAHELFQAGHRYLDVRTPEEFSAGHASGAINIPYMYRVGSGMVKNPNFLAEVSSHFGKYDEIIVGCQIGKRSFMAATDLLAAGFSGITDIAGGYAAWTQNGLPTQM
ncbi:thiosulfate sulfurtransferase 16, chloroplastic-like [Alnus glutinosa]|uniref:thiosulfate sulfurtransferase 16, chloroplastic-like n=1 Tax=Alnus glutinosa TaxID=3517 RepID=UPI002D789AA9|nr:thiosulfate sulfurtransferase 16, chloroplastic-like [Alnus glutinosa]